MGFLDQLRMSTGLALEPAEAYTRAFEKGVLLGPAHFMAASEMFGTAARMLAPANTALAQRATANAYLYAFLGRRDIAAAASAARCLSTLEYVEQPGTADEIVDAQKLARELDARVLEAHAAAASASGHAAAADAYRAAAAAWLPLLDYRPITFGFSDDDAFYEDGTMRFFLDSAHGAMLDGARLAPNDPELAAESYALASQAFGRAGALERSRDARQRLHAARLERPCWFCGRRVQGLGDNLRVLSCLASEYMARLARTDRDRGEAYEVGRIYTCATCASAVDAVAEARAAAVRDVLSAQIRAVAEAVDHLSARVRSVEARRYSP